MSAFLTPLRHELIKHPYHRVLEPLLYFDPKGRLWEVPPGFVSDGASIPWPFRAALPHHGSYTRAAYLHDWLFVTRPLERREIDRLMVASMEDDEVNPVIRFVISQGLRVGSWKPWYYPVEMHPENERFIGWYDNVQVSSIFGN